MTRENRGDESRYSDLLVVPQGSDNVEGSLEVLRTEIVAACAMSERVKTRLLQAIHAQGTQSLSPFQLEILLDAASVLGRRLQRLRSESANLEQAIQQMDVDLAQLRAAAERDPLTGLLNRRGLFRLLGPLMRQQDTMNRPVAMVVLDIDDFKEINDQYGHPMGDEVLCRLAAHFQVSVRQHDLVARLGGDEFVVVLSDVSEEGALRIAERLKFSGNLTKGEVICPVTVSGGFARSLMGMDPFELLSLADQALYTAKSLGKDTLSVFREQV